MKTATWIVSVLVMSMALGYLLAKPRAHFTGREWGLSLPVPRCDPSQNVQVIWPENGGPITIECDDFPNNGK